MTQLNDSSINISSLIEQLESLQSECKSIREGGDSNQLPLIYQKFRFLISQTSKSLADSSTISTSPTRISSSSVHSRNGLKRSQSLILNDYKINENSTIKYLTDELKKTKAKLLRPCEMCKNYEIQLQSVEENVAQLNKKLNESKQKMKSFEDDLNRERNNKSELEEKFIKESKDFQRQIKELDDRNKQSNKDLVDIRSLFNIYFNEANDKITTLTKMNEKLKSEVKSLAAENNHLLGRYINKSQDLQSEAINLPQDLNEMQFYCLKLREDLITALTIKERNEETFRSEIVFLGEQHKAELQAKGILEENLTQENDSLRNQLEMLKKKHDDYIVKYSEQETMLNQYQNRIKLLLQENEQLTSNVQWRSNDLSAVKAKQVHLEEENNKLKSKLVNLQNELENSEFVQRDFVKLSQSLQVQLENIRQSDVEVRWQHEDDIKDCNQCHKQFHSKKEKVHCSHCGRIFCSECNAKIVLGGPNRRQFKVCSVCHTLLDRDTAPYFSNEPPQTPT